MLEKEERAFGQVARAMLLVLQDYLRWPALLWLMGALALAYGLVSLLGFNHHTLSVILVLGLLEALLIFRRVQHTKIFLVKQVFVKMGWFLYICFYLPYFQLLWSPLSSLTTTPAVIYLTLYFTVALLFWQLPAKMEARAKGSLV